MNKSTLSLIINHFNEVYPEKSTTLAQQINSDTDLLMEGLYDSMAFMELLSFLMDAYGKDIDFESLDLENIAKISYLSKIFSEVQ